MRRGLVVLLLLSACSGGGSGDPRATPTVREIPFPYPFVTPTPPEAPTAIDGTYERAVPDAAAGPVGKCRRCPPYRLELGDTNTLRLDAGVFTVAHALTDWKNAGHYVLDGDRIELFNDPNCPKERGVYAFTLEGGTLTLEVVEDRCAFGGLRARYLTATSWPRA